MSYFFRLKYNLLYRGNYKQKIGGNIMVIFIIVYFIGAIVELVCDYFINKAMFNEILSGNHLMVETLRLIKIRRLRYKFVFILMRALLWPIPFVLGTIWEIITKKHNFKDFVDYFCN